VVTSPGGSVQTVTGPNVAQIGNGSVRLFVPQGDLSAEVRLPTFHLTPLEQLTGTFDLVNNANQWPYIILQIDFTGDTTIDDLIFFEPAFQTPTTGNPTLPDQGPPVLNDWQRWNAMAGGWWSLNSIGGATPGLGVKPLSPSAHCHRATDARPAPNQRPSDAHPTPIQRPSDAHPAPI
jgi:hypothetical protein